MGVVAMEVAYQNAKITAIKILHFTSTMLERFLKSATRKSLGVFDLKLGRLTRFQLAMLELETSRRELETTKLLLSPIALSYQNSRQTSQPLKTHPITQIFISTTESEPGRPLQECIQSVKRCFPESEHKLYNNQEIEEFIEKHYDKELLDVYKDIKPFAYKADLARLCILSIVGGWYVDIGVTWTIPLTIPDDIQLFALRDRNHYCKSSWACCNAIIFAREQHPALRCGIEIIRGNFKSKYYGATPLCPTGPNVWGKAIAKMAESTETLFADVCELTPRHPHKNLAYVTEDGKIFAFAKPSVGGDGLVAFGETGSNSYNEFYSQKDIYATSN